MLIPRSRVEEVRVWPAIVGSARKSGMKRVHGCGCERVGVAKGDGVYSLIVPGAPRDKNIGWIKKGGLIVFGPEVTAKNGVLGVLNPIDAPHTLVLVLYGGR